MILNVTLINQIVITITRLVSVLTRIWWKYCRIDDEVASNSLFEGCECGLKSLCDTGSCSNYIELTPGAWTVYWHTHIHTHTLQSNRVLLPVSCIYHETYDWFFEKENNCRNDRSIRTNLDSNGPGEGENSTQCFHLSCHSLHSSRGSSFASGNINSMISRRDAPSGCDIQF